ncbi:MAG: Uncharacterized protein XD60_0149 [Acetothermia bacterium 64_32]|nr:MAG: Uncharacterized protein XD60_0149 [Acetothermia bacterium 64_32]
MATRCDRLDANVTLKTDIMRLRTDQSVWSSMMEGETVILASSESNIPRGQEWFWTPQWQAGEREASRELEEGRGFGPFESVAEMKACFEAWRKAQETAKAGS